nr:protein UL49 [Equid gammaherpesvirus 5]
MDQVRFREIRHSLGYGGGGGDCRAGGDEADGLMVSLCEDLRIGAGDCALFVLYGVKYWGVPGSCPDWVGRLVRCERLSDFATYLLACRRAGGCRFTGERRDDEPPPGPPPPLPSLQESVAALQRLFLAFALVIFRRMRVDGEAAGEAVARMARDVHWNLMLTQGPDKATVTFLNAAGLSSYSLPLVRCDDNMLNSLVKMKRKSRNYFQNDTPLAVPAPRLRLGPECMFLRGDHGDPGAAPRSSSFSSSAHDESFLKALGAMGGTVPCGNPFNAMMKALAFQSMISSRYVVLPNTGDIKSFAAHDLYSKILGYNILCPFLSLPVHRGSSAAAAAAAAAGEGRGVGARLAVVCAECGYCLNLGKGKFKKASFNPTHIFYCRDQKEKYFTICASTGRIYCSFCGSCYIKTYPLKFTVGNCQYIRAVGAGNCAIAVSDSSTELDLVLPCLGNGCGQVLLRRVVVADLFHATEAGSSRLYCPKCLKPAS